MSQNHQAVPTKNRAEIRPAREGGSANLKLSSGPRSKILVADDEPDTLLLTTYALQKAGYEVILAENGLEALEKARQEGPAIAILDRMMPQMDGLEACRRLREAQPGIFIMLLTAMGAPDDRVDGLEAGADDYLVKPISGREMVLRVKAVLRRLEDQKTAQSPGELPPAEVSGPVAPPLEAEPEPEPLTEDDKFLVARQRKLQSVLLRASRAAQGGNMTYAREVYEQALHLDPFDPMALKWLAYHTYDPHEGCLYLERLIQVQPDNQKARRLLEIGRERCKELDHLAFTNLMNQLNTVEPASDVVSSPRLSIGHLLVERGYITRENIEAAANLQEMFRRSGFPRKLGEILVEYDFLSEEQLHRVLREQDASKPPFWEEN